jgi:hypothetical protein
VDDVDGDAPTVGTLVAEGEPLAEVDTVLVVESEAPCVTEAVAVVDRDAE